MKDSKFFLVFQKLEHFGIIFPKQFKYFKEEEAALMGSKLDEIQDVKKSSNSENQRDDIEITLKSSINKEMLIYIYVNVL